MAANALVPRDQAESLEGHFFANRRLFFAARGLVVLNFWIVGVAHFDVSFLAPGRLVGLLFLVICAVGIASSNRRTHAILAILGLAAEVVAVGYQRYSAGSLGLGGA